MKQFLKYHKKQIIGGVIYVLLFAAPVVTLLLEAGNPGLAIPNSRRWGLLRNTISLGVLTAIGCLLIGFYAAVGIFTGRLREKSLRWWFLLLLPVPQYIYALSWMELVRLLGKICPPLLRMQIFGLLPCVIVEVMAYLPICTALALLGLERQDVRLAEAGLLCKKGDTVLYGICLTQMLPWLLSGAGCVFVLSATDFSIPSLFQYNVYAMELFSDFSAYGRAVNSFWLAIPLIILILIVVMLSQNGLQQIFIPVRSHSQVRLYLSGLTKGICTAAIGLCVMQILIPVVTLTVGIGSWEQLTASAVLAGEELMISCGIGLMAALLTIFPAFAAAAILCSTGNRFLRMLFLFPLAMPGALIGVGWLELLNGSFLHGITGTLLFPALGCATRFMPFGTMILTGMLFRVDKKCLEAAEVLQSSNRKAFLAVKLPMFAPGILASGLLVFLLAIGDVGVTLMTAPPGKEPFSIKIYNYLHYGASEMVSGFCMVVVLVCLTVTVAMIGLLRMRKHGN